MTGALQGEPAALNAEAQKLCNRLLVAVREDVAAHQRVLALLEQQQQAVSSLPFGF